MTKRATTACGEEKTAGQRLAIVSMFCLTISLILLGIFFLAHAGRPDSLMYATIIPVFFWLAVGLLATAGIRNYRSLRRAMFALWLVLALALGDSPQNLLRGLIPADAAWTSARESKLDLGLEFPIRIISINCGKELAAISELATLQPDVILMQEYVPEEELNQSIKTNFPGYSLVWSGNAMILVRGTANPFKVPQSLYPRMQFSAVALANGAKFNVVSLHLQPSPRQIDVWNIETWKLFADLRKLRRQQLSQILVEIDEVMGDNPTVIGGDFNAPAGDQIFELMSPRFRDGWAEAGRGWGKTSLNAFPIHRLDQVWITKQFDMVNVRARKSNSSDHRMVICDLWLKR